jgi:hypothetical protein
MGAGFAVVHGTENECARRRGREIIELLAVAGAEA